MAEFKRTTTDNVHHGLWLRSDWLSHSPESGRAREHAIMKVCGPIVVHDALHKSMKYDGIYVPAPKVMKFLCRALIDFEKVPATRADKWAWIISRLDKFQIGESTQYQRDPRQT